MRIKRKVKEVLYNLGTRMRIAAVGRCCGVNEWMVHFIEKNAGNIRGSFKACALSNAKLSCVSRSQPFLVKLQRSCGHGYVVRYRKGCQQYVVMEKVVYLQNHNEKDFLRAVGFPNTIISLRP